jgi:hypothetical protein
VIHAGYDVGKCQGEDPVCCDNFRRVSWSCSFLMAVSIRHIRVRVGFIIQSLELATTFASFFHASRGNLSVTGPVTNPEARALSNLEAVMIKRKHIDHGELLELGKMLLLLIKRQQITVGFSSLTEPDKRVTEVGLARAS